MTGRGALLGGGLLALAVLGGVVLFLDGGREPPETERPAAPGAPPVSAPAAPSPTAPPPDAPAAPPLEGGTGAVVGRLVRGSPPSPVPGRVTVAGPDGGTLAAAVDATGLFRLDGLPAGPPLAFEATSPGLLPHRLPWVRLASGEPLDLGDLALGAGAPVPVEVVDGRGRPVAGASVTLRRWPAAPRDSLSSEVPEGSAVPPSLRASTGAEGRVVLEGTPPGPWRVEVAAAGFAPREDSFTVVEGQASSPLRFLLLPALSLAGIVSIFDTPAEGAVVEAVEQNFTRRVRSRPADADGAYLLEGLDAGRWTLSVRPTPDTEICVGGLDLPGLERFDIRLPAGGRVLGTVLDDATGAPVPGALVTLRTDGVGFLDDSAAARTAADGRFSLDHLPPGIPILTGFSVTAPGFLDFPDGRSEPAVPVAALFPGSADGIVVRLRRGAAVVGRVLDPEGEPIPGARVFLIQSIRGRGDDSSLPAGISDGEGRWRLSQAGSGAGLLIVFAAGFCQEEFPEDPAAALSAGTVPAAWTVEVPVSGEARKDLVLSRGGGLEGTVVDAGGAPVAGAAISCRPEGGWDELGTAGPSDAEGRFRVAGVPSGRALEVSASLPDRPDGRSDPLTLGPGETVRDLRIVLPAPAALAGILRREDGTPLRSPLLRIVDGEPEEGALDPMILRMAAYRPVAPDGSFRVEGLAAGTWTLAAEDEGCAPAVGPVVVLGEGERREGLEAILPAGLSIAGRVVDGKGAPLSGAVVLVARVFGKYSTASIIAEIQAPAASTFTDEAGAFRKDGLPSGPHSVTVRAQGTLERSVEAPAGTADLVIVMESGLSITGRVVDAEDGRPVAGVRVTARLRESGREREMVSGGNGEFAFDGLPSGEVDLRFDTESEAKVGEHGAKTLRGVAAGSSGLQVALPRGLVIAGRVVDEEGRAIASALAVQVVGRSNGEFQSASRDEKEGGDGTFRVGGLLPGVYTLTVSSFPDYLPTVERGLRSGTDGIVLVLRRAGRIAGRVIDGDGLPVGSGVPVAALAEEADGRDSGLHGSTRTREDGSFEIGMLGPHRFSLTAGGGNRCDFLFSIHPEDVAIGATDVEIRVVRGASLSGTLLDSEGGAVGGRTVRALAAGFASDWFGVNDDGAFHLRGLPPGTVTLEVRDGDGGTIPLGEWTAPGENLRVVVPER